MYDVTGQSPDEYRLRRARIRAEKTGETIAEILSVFEGAGRDGEFGRPRRTDAFSAAGSAPPSERGTEQRATEQRGTEQHGRRHGSTQRAAKRRRTSEADGTDRVRRLRPVADTAPDSAADLAGSLDGSAADSAAGPGANSADSAAGSAGSAADARRIGTGPCCDGEDEGKGAAERPVSALADVVPFERALRARR